MSDTTFEAPTVEEALEKAAAALGAGDGGEEALAFRHHLDGALELHVVEDLLEQRADVGGLDIGLLRASAGS